MQTNVVRSNKERIRELTLLAIFIAIIAVLGLVPSFGLGSSSLGFIRIAPNIEATIIHIPVLIGGALLGRKMSIYLGLAFGVVSLIAAFIYSSPLFVYPWVSVLPRLAFGFLIYDVTRFFLRIIKNRHLAYGVSFLVLTVIHTLLVLSMLWTSFAIYMDMGLFESFLPYLAWLVYVLVPVSAAIEAGIAAVVGAVVAVRLRAYLDNRAEESPED
ncbi:MAG: ECF transporter S component [Candidatus Izemoplasmatales bacterium]